MLNFIIGFTNISNGHTWLTGINFLSSLPGFGSRKLTKDPVDQAETA